MAQTGPEALEKAAACEALAQRSEDGKLRERFLKLRDSWIRIANSAELTGDPLTTKTVEKTSSDPRRRATPQQDIDLRE